jgi:Helix-turn-helix
MTKHSSKLNALRSEVSALPLDRQAALAELLDGGQLSSALLQGIIQSGLTCYALAKQTGLVPMVVSRFISGERDLRLRTAGKIAAALGLELKPVNATPYTKEEVQAAVAEYIAAQKSAKNEPSKKKLLEAAQAAARLFRPPYKRNLSGINLTPMPGEQADWDKLRAALEAAGVEIGEELT